MDAQRMFISFSFWFYVSKMKLISVCLHAKGRMGELRVYVLKVYIIFTSAQVLDQHSGDS